MKRNKKNHRYLIGGERNAVVANMRVGDKNHTVSFP